MLKGINFKQLKDVFLSFFKIGCFTFGGGYAMIPLIEKEVITNKKWVSKEDIVDILAVSQSIPGAVAINSATLIGYKIAGKKGAYSATLGVVLPSFTIITIIAAFFSRFQDNHIVQAAFMGIRPAVVALIITAAVKIGKVSIKDKPGLVICALSVILVVVLNIHAILTIISGATFGLVIYRLFPSKVKKIMELEKCNK